MFTSDVLTLEALYENIVAIQPMEIFSKIWFEVQLVQEETTDLISNFILEVGRLEGGTYVGKATIVLKRSGLRPPYDVVM